MNSNSLFNSFEIHPLSTRDRERGARQNFVRLWDRQHPAGSWPARSQQSYKKVTHTQCHLAD